MLKICSVCKQEKDSTLFYRRMAKCKLCHRQVCYNWRDRNPEKIKASMDKWRAKPGSREKQVQASTRWQAEHPEQAKRIRLRGQLKQYGLTIEQFEEIEQLQQGRCAICSKVPSRRLDVDHNHTTGVVRQLLCANCNTAVGLLQEDPSLALKLAEYLQRHINQG